MVIRYCYLCCKTIELKGSIKEHQNSEHVEDIKNCKISNNMADVVRSACKICGDNVKIHMMRSHTKKAHQMTITEYKSKYNQTNYDLVELILHQCCICSEYLLLDSDSVAQHLKTGGHNITHANYNAQYMKISKMKSNIKESISKAKPQKLSQEKENRKQTVEAIPRALIDNQKYNSKVDEDSLNNRLNKNQGFNEPTSSDNYGKKNDATTTYDFEKPNDLLIELQELNASKMSNSVSQVCKSIVPNDISPLHLQNFDDENLSSNETHENLDITVENFRKFLDSISENGENLRYPVLEMLLTLNI